MEARDISQSYAFQAEASQNVRECVSVSRIGQRHLECLFQPDHVRSGQVGRIHNRRIQNGSYGDAHGSGGAGERAVAEGECKAVGTMEVSSRCIGQSRSSATERAVGGVSNHSIGHRAGEEVHTAQGDGGWSIFHNGHGLSCCVRNIIECDLYAHRGA